MAINMRIGQNSTLSPQPINDMMSYGYVRPETVLRFAHDNLAFHIPDCGKPVVEKKLFYLNPIII